jgi:hypothetical protein
MVIAVPKSEVVVVDSAITGKSEYIPVCDRFVRV